jgi:DNA-binding MarR family transcriptional regulator
MDPRPPARWLAEAKRRFPDVDPAALATTLRLVGLGHGITAFVERHLEAIGLTSARFTLLMRILGLEWDGVAATPSRLAERGGVGRAAMTQMLDGLVAGDWIERHSHPDDRRKVTVALSAEGRTRLEGFLPGHYARMAAMMAPLGPDGVAELQALLSRIGAGLSVLEDAER